MTPKMDRRDFVRIAAWTVMGAQAAQTGAAGESVFRLPDKSQRVKVGLYSITFLGLWYRGKEMPLDEMIRWAKKAGYEGVEIDGKRPHGNPLDWPTPRCKELRRIADGEGIPIYGIAANNDFSSPIPEFRQAQLAYVRDLIRMTADVGAQTLRVFLAWPGVTLHPQIARYDIARNLWKTTHAQFMEEETWNWCRDGMMEACKYAADWGVTLALQNHAPLIKDHRDVLRMIREVNSPQLKVSLDAPIMRDKSPAAIRTAALEVGALQALSHFSGDYRRGAGGEILGTAAFYSDFIRMMKEIGYTGYLGYELCHSLPVVNGQTVGIEYAEESAQLACQYMKGLIAQAYGEAKP